MQPTCEALSAEARVPVPAVDLRHLARYTLGNRALEAEVLALFAAQLPQMLAVLQSPCGEHEWRGAAHSLKGSARAVGAWRLARLAEQAEQIGPRAAAVELLAAIETAIADAEGFIATLGKEPSCCK